MNVMLKGAVSVTERTKTDDGNLPLPAAPPVLFIDIDCFEHQ